jgi:hypothetical protein
MNGVRARIKAINPLADAVLCLWEQDRPRTKHIAVPITRSVTYPTLAVSLIRQSPEIYSTVR